MDLVHGIELAIMIIFVLKWLDADLQKDIKEEELQFWKRKYYQERSKRIK